MHRSFAPRTSVRESIALPAVPAAAITPAGAAIPSDAAVPATRTVRSSGAAREHAGGLLAAARAHGRVAASARRPGFHRATAAAAFCLLFAWTAGAAVAQAPPPVATPPVDPAADPAGAPTGHWEGAIELPGHAMTILVDLQRAPDGAWSGSIDIPEQGAKGLPLGDVAAEADTVRFAIAGIPGDPRFAGTHREERIEGNFTQGGQTFPFYLGRDRVKPPNRPQEPKPPFPYRVEEVSYQNGDVTLAGTLTIPAGEGPFPAALLVTGSGAQNRDEELLGHKPFLVLADHLTRAGLVVLRVDDRGIGGSSGSTMESTTEDFAGDALAGVAFLRARPECDPKRVGLIGHSEGGVVAPLAASRSEEVAFVVMLAGTGVPGSEVLLQQTVAIGRAMEMDPRALAFQDRLLRAAVEQTLAGTEAEGVAEAVRRAAEAELGGAGDTTAAPGDSAAATAAAPDDSLRARLLEVKESILLNAPALTAPWFRAFLAYDPRPPLRSLRVPVLALNGELDMQVLPDQNLPEIEKALAASGHPDATVRRLPGLNHLFQPATTGSPLEYAGIDTTMSPVALEAVSGWILERFGPGAGD